MSAYDLAIVGGGVNGAAIARDAAGRGLKVALVEAGDLAGATSSASTKLIHGGLRYLEHFEFRLVREALIERETMLAQAPHIVWPLRFVLPHAPHLRPRWMIRAGLFLYDRLAGGMSLPKSRGIDLRRGLEGRPLKEEFRKGFVYSDCWVDDARLVVLNALDAAAHGAEIRTRAACCDAKGDGELWRIGVKKDGRRREIAARALVNAAGPWAGGIKSLALGRKTEPALRLVKGSHFVTRRLFEGEHAYIFQTPDGRVVFAIPFERHFTLIGTTEAEYSGDPRAAAMSDEEAAYLCGVLSGYFGKDVRPEDALWSFAGVRPLYDDAEADASAVSRDYVLDLDAGDKPPLLSVFGGKITTSRKLAEQALEKLEPFFPGLPPAWTQHATLPGGEMADGFGRFLDGFQRRRPWLPGDLAFALARRHGTRVERVTGGALSLKDLGDEICPGLYEAEIDYLRREEWAVEAEDILWRRSKIGLHAPKNAAETLGAYMARS